jgi:hypothetical protein
LNLSDTSCSDCGHYKTAHPKALGFCTVCHHLAAVGMAAGPLCRRVYVSIFSQGELEQLTHVARDSFDQWAVCAVCACYWMEHTGALCPSGNSTFKPLIGVA